MNLKSLGYKSQLIFTDFDGKAEDRGDHWAIHTLSNPNFFWGNLLIFDRPPKAGDFAPWTAQFKKEFTDPSIYHVTLAWDSSTGEVGDVSEFLQNGFRRLKFNFHPRTTICPAQNGKASTDDKPNATDEWKKPVLEIGTELSSKKNW